MGDPYQPFREILGLLTGDIETAWRAGAITRAQATSLWNAFPLAVGKLLEQGQDLIDAMVPAQALLARLVDCGLGDIIDAERLRRSAASETPTGGLRQAALFEQTVDVLRAALQIHSPSCLFWKIYIGPIPARSNLLFHLGRHLAGSAILVVGSFRPEEIAQGRNGEQHPLAHVLGEFQRANGEITVDLRRSDGRGFVEALLETQPNSLGAAFRETLYQQSGGHALFTVELVRDMQDRGDLVRDEDGRWIEGVEIDWETLPARVEAVVAQRINRLPANLRDLLASSQR